ncbi:MAG TPA: nuclear transport factor 2 family protein [Solirubrobacteraceae bacterium]|nr:nuclear transport factor 2 family protein [Solirubrobacteraceae bacterium]
MAEEDIANARRSYAAINQAYRSGDPTDYLPILEELFHPDAVLGPADILPEAAPVQGWDGVMGFMAEQMKAFTHGSIWIEPLEYIDGEDVMVVPYRFGGRAAYIEWRAVEGAVDDVGVFRGRERMRRYYADWLAPFDELESDVESVLGEEGDVAAVIIVTRARPRGTDAWARGRYAVVYTVRGGLVVRGREYPSADAARAAAAALSG